MSIYLGENKIADNTCSRNIGEIVASTIPLNDAGLHLLDGALISSVGSYAKFVNYIAGLVTDYPDLFTTEANWQSAVTTYGVCGKFVYDSTNNTVRLPKITGFTEGTIDPTTLGDLTQAGLPNITGSPVYTFTSSAAEDVGSLMSGPFYQTSAVKGSAPLTNTSAYRAGFGFDASRSNSIYGNSTTVQPQSIKVLYYIVIANSVKTNIEVDIDEIATDLNGKADVDFSNITSTGTSLASGWSMPSSRYIDLTLGATGVTYTAPANGWIVFDGTGSNSHWQLNNQTRYMTATWTYAQNIYAAHGFLPVMKGDVVAVYYNSSKPSSSGYFRFVYAEGEN